MQAPHQWLSDFIKDTCVTMILKLFCHWTAAMLQCLILRVVLWHCIFVLCCGFITGSGSGAAAAVALCSSAPHIVHCTMRINVHCTLLSYIVHCHHTAFVALLMLYRLCPLTKVYKHRAQCRKVLDLGHSVAGGVLVWARIWTAILPAKIYGMA